MQSGDQLAQTTSNAGASAPKTLGLAGPVDPVSLSPFLSARFSQHGQTMPVDSTISDREDAVKFYHASAVEHLLCGRIGVPMFKVTDHVANTSAEPVEVWFEPWGTPHSLQPGETFCIVAESEQQGQLEIEQSSSRIVVFGWPRCTIKVFCGDELIDDFSVKFPELPPGRSTKSFIDLMFGGP